MSSETFSSLPTVPVALAQDYLVALQGGVNVIETVQQILDLGLSNNVLTYAGNPNSNVSGNVYQLLWDTLDSFLWVCTATGSTTTAVWTKTTAALGTPLSGVLTNCTGLPISTGVAGLGTGVATFLATPTSANLAAAVTNETGSGALVFGTSPTITTPIIGGITSGSSAAAGVVGEVISATLASGSAVSLTSTTAANVTSISLTAGDWDVYGQVGFVIAGTTTVSSISASINTVTGTLADVNSIHASTQTLNATLTTGVNQLLNAGSCVLNVSSPTTVYLVASCTFATSTAAAYGSIFARRRR